MTPIRLQRASALVETLLAAPMVLLLGLGALQWSLLFHARTALEYAVFEAARAGSVGQAQAEAIEAGLARGLMPFWFGIDAPEALPAALARSTIQLRVGLSAGSIAWQQRSPSIESFDDWGEPARDPMGYPVAGIIEIPNDNLQWASLRAPASGVAARRGAEPIGARSQQTLNDANLLKLELRYGVPLTVPLVGRFAAWIMQIVDGCAQPTRLRLALLDLGTPDRARDARSWTCPFYQAPDASGNAVPRWPIRVAATIRMQSPARRGPMTPRRMQSVASAAGTSANAPVAAREPTPAWGTPPGMPAPVAFPSAGSPSMPSPAQPASRTSDGIADRADGWLQIGGERTFSVPGACT